MVTRVGIIGDIHGDLAGYEAAMRLLTLQGVERVICAGDIVDRGSDADAIVADMQQRGIPSVRGNHEVTIAKRKEMYRKDPPDLQEGLRRIGRIVTAETLAYIEALPETLRFTIEGVRLLVAHGTPYSDVTGVFPDSRTALFRRLDREYGGETDVLILGHTHMPMVAQTSQLRILNAGSVYGVTMRDSQTCGVLHVPSLVFHVYDLNTGEPMDVQPVTISTEA